MDLKFSFGASNPLPSSEGAGSASAAGMGASLLGTGSFSQSPGSSVLELRVSLASTEHAHPDSTDGDSNASKLVCEGLSPDGVSYGRAEKAAAACDASSLAAALRSVLARCGAELPEPLLGSVSAIVLDLAGREEEVLAELGLAAAGGAQLASVDGALQARTGITAGTPITAA